jgi:RNase H-fold protein (predicted Holliday junction resolvase)
MGHLAKDWDKAPARVEKTSDLVWDLQVYPREQVDRVVVKNYARALKAGSIFPSVKIGVFAGEKVIVDGVHRVKAHELNKIDYVNCSELIFDSQAELFAEAVKLNASHGKSFTEKELKKNIQRLQRFKFSVKEIQVITSVPASEIYRDSALPIVTLTAPSGRKILCNSCKTIGQPNIHEVIQFKNALMLIRDVADKGCIPTDDAYFQTLVTQCRDALGKIRFNS